MFGINSTNDTNSTGQPADNKLGPAQPAVDSLPGGSVAHDPMSIGLESPTSSPGAPVMPPPTSLPSSNENHFPPTDPPAHKEPDMPALSAPAMPTGGQPANDLIQLKQQALQSLAPLVDKLDQTPEEKFKTTMMMLQASDNADLVKEAYAAANEITDEKARAHALLDVVNEINYFTQNGGSSNDKPAA